MLRNFSSLCGASTLADSGGIGVGERVRLCEGIQISHNGGAESASGESGSQANLYGVGSSTASSGVCTLHRNRTGRLTRSVGRAARLPLLARMNTRGTFSLG